MAVRKWIWRGLAVIWLTYNEQANWTRLPIYIGYIFINPVFQIALYGYIYIAVAHISGLTDPASAFYMVSGVALYNFIGSGLYGVIWTIHSEREHYNTLKYSYLALPNLHLYLISRGLYHYLTGFITSLAMIILGYLLIGRGLPTPHWGWIYIPILLIIGVLWSANIGVMVAGISIYSAENGPIISEAIGGLLFLVGAVLYPPSTLPDWIEPIAYILPIYEWMELMRASIDPTYIPGDIHSLWTMLLIKSVAWILISIAYFRVVEKLALRSGMLEASLHH